MDARMEYDEIRGTWNVYIGAEWYYESKDYEQANEVLLRCNCDDDDDYYGDDGDTWEDDWYYTPSSTRGDYSPSCPWNAPGMSVSDFI